MLSRLIDRDGVAQFGSLVWRTSTTPDAPKSDKASGLDSAGIEQMAEAAYRAGLADGEARAAARLNERVGAMEARVSDAVAGLALLRPKLMATAQADVIRLALRIAERVMHRELTIDPGALSSIVDAALQKLGNQEKYRVRTHPALAESLRKQLEERSAAGAEVAPDSTLPPGSVIFETERGALDASLDTQLAEIERAVERRHQEEG